MSEAVLLAIIGGFFALVSAAFGVVTTYLTLTAPQRMAKLNIEAAAEALRVANERTDRIAAEAKADRAAQALDTNRKLASLHLLVDGVYTAAKVNELRAVKKQLDALEQSEWLGPTTDGQAEIAAATDDAKRLGIEIAARDEAAQVATEALRQTTVNIVKEAAHVPGVQVHVDANIAPTDVVDVMRERTEPDVVPMIGEPRRDPDKVQPEDDKPA